MTTDPELLAAVIRAELQRQADQVVGARPYMWPSLPGTVTVDGTFNLLELAEAILRFDPDVLPEDSALRLTDKDYLDDCVEASSTASKPPE